MEDVFSTVVMLSTPGGSQGFSRLRMELDKAAWAALDDPKELWVELPSDELMFLPGS